MCGILFAKLNNMNEDGFRSALSLLGHRGPDNLSYNRYDEYFIGHTRLSIIDVESRSDQPFLASDGVTIISFNGEIYNYKELAKEFQLLLKTTSDTEVLVELYLKIGEKVLDHINGMFSFVIFNTKAHEFFVARDRLGIKPLYCHFNNDGFIFSSEVSPVLDLIGNQEIDEVGLRQYLKLRTFFRGHTIYRNIKIFPAGCFMRNNKIEQRFWSLEGNDFGAKFEEEKMRFLIESSVQYRLRSDVDVGSYLSGGLDSSIVSLLARPEHTWTVGFEEDNEFYYSDLMAERYGFSHHKVLVDKEDFLVMAQEMIKKRREPLSVPNEVLLYLMTKVVKNYNKVVLSGEGADELFLGYDRIFRWAKDNDFTVEGFDKMYSYGAHKDDEILDYVLEPVACIKDNLLKVTNFFQIYHLHGLLRRLDNSTMQNSVEARVPFCDHRLVEYMYDVGFNDKMRNGIVKYLLKKAFENELPREVVERKKVGFPVPLKNIFDSNFGMDTWLNFNLEVLFQQDAGEIKRQYGV